MGLAQLHFLIASLWNGERSGDSKLPAIDVKNGKFIAVGNVFHQNKLSINLQAGVEQAIVSNNMLSGSEEATFNIVAQRQTKTNYCQ